MARIQWEIERATEKAVELLQTAAADAAENGEWEVRDQKMETIADLQAGQKVINTAVKKQVLHQLIHEDNEKMCADRVNDAIRAQQARLDQIRMQ